MGCDVTELFCEVHGQFRMALTDSGAATEWRCDNAMETDSGGNTNNSDVSTRLRMRDAVQRIKL